MSSNKKGEEVIVYCVLCEMEEKTVVATHTLDKGVGSIPVCKKCYEENKHLKTFELDVEF